MVADSYTEALKYSEQSLAVAVAPLDPLFLLMARGAPWYCFGKLETGAN